MNIYNQIKTTRAISDDGIERLIERESVELTAYQDVAGIWTIGVGHTGADVYEGLTVTYDQAISLLHADIERFETVVNRCIDVYLEQHEYDALVSLAFNIGVHAFKTSTVVRLINANDFLGAADAFMMWKKAGARVVQGLINRRKDERAQFLGIGL
ncbi:lysozyme [Salinicola sp. CPA57]|uniref:lysozyme n=1 Tax=Salinicola sp. CPA57 TaxID=1949080 RepID=UPI000DA13E76|nr:lysozyme [Salinicola sp. CPA57]